jgi:hypothetical protein
MKKLYDKFMELNIEAARKRCQRRGIHFNEEKYIKRQKATLPVMIWYIIVIIFSKMLPGFVPDIVMLLIFLILILKGLNDYFGWIKIQIKD